MADGVLGLGSGASSLNNDLIDQLKEAERKSTVEPLETQIEDIEGEGGEAEKIAEITAKVNELLDSVEPFDLFVSGGVTAFDQKSANASGSSVVFDADDESALNEGTTRVFVEQLAKRDVFQSSDITLAEKDSNIDEGTLEIAIKGSDDSYSTVYTFDTDGKTYEELVEEMNYKSGITASLEQVGDETYKLVIKSAESGIANELRMTGAASQALGYTDDGASGGYTEAENANIQEATNLLAEVNGIEYNISSNVITVDGGLKITAIEEDETDDSGNPTSYSTISVENDTTTIETFLQDFVDNYNELVALVDTELYSTESKVDDKSTLRTMMEGVKDYLFNTYGTNDDLSIFNFGFELDEYGSLSIDSTVLNDAVDDNLDDLKSLFLGVAEDEGLGTQLKTYLDSLDTFNGLLYEYEESMDTRLSSLEDEKEKAIETLDNKYSLMSQQFADYNVIISQFENSFSGLSLLIDQSVASN